MKVLVCLRASVPSHVESFLCECSECGESVWVAYESPEMEIEKVLCTECFPAVVQREVAELFVMPEGKEGGGR
jgi:hypothetical protein